MTHAVVVDTGPLVALLNQSDHAHAWVLQQMADLRPPLITCEAVLAEATYLTRRVPGARIALMEMVGEGFLNLGLAVADQHAALLTMMRRYADVPMSLADACLVRLAELNPKSVVFTLDRDFVVYRKNTRHAIPLLCPW